jgi:hypothetical protein
MLSETEKTPLFVFGDDTKTNDHLTLVHGTGHHHRFVNTPCMDGRLIGSCHVVTDVYWLANQI